MAFEITTLAQAGNGVIFDTGAGGGSQKILLALTLAKTLILKMFSIEALQPIFILKSTVELSVGLTSLWHTIVVNMAPISSTQTSYRIYLNGVAMQKKLLNQFLVLCERVFWDELIGLDTASYYSVGKSSCNRT
jgi:hypothetical protein